jgi:serine/threonine protein kinase/Tol biopolymer transport system component
MDMPQVGGEFAGYRIQRMIGRGGMAFVYQAESSRMGRVVALKVLAPELAQDDAFRERFVRESKLAASLDHPNIVPIYDAGDEGGLLYIAMRYVKGGLKALLQHKGRLTPERTTSLIAQIASGLDAAHDLQLVHRDVKPANILIAFGSVTGEQDHVYLADFGLMKHSTSLGGLTGTGQFVGTLDYMSPEQIQGEPVDGRTDVYALGCILYECLTGEVPFDRNSDAAVMWAHLKEDPPSASGRARGVTPGIDDVITKALSKSPDDRFPTCTALVTALRAQLSTSPRETESKAATATAKTVPRQKAAPHRESDRPPPEAVAPEAVAPEVVTPEPPPSVPDVVVTRPARDVRTRERSWRWIAFAGAVVLGLGILGLYLMFQAGETTRQPSSRLAGTTRSGPQPAAGDAAGLVFASDSGGLAHIYSCVVSKAGSCRRDSAGSRATLLTNENVPDEDPVWSPTGRIAFVRGHQPAEIYAMDDDGSDVEALTSNSIHEDDPSWSPDGSEIAFTRGLPADIHVMDARGQRDRQVTDHPADDQDPAWSPDGTMLAFVRWQESDVAIYVVGRNGEGETPVTSDPATEIRHPSWSPSGERITFASDWEGNMEIYVVNADGTGLTRLTHSPSTDDVGPSWSTDGRTIAFVKVWGEKRNLFSVNASGSGPEIKLQSGLPVAFDPAWSPIDQ